MSNGFFVDGWSVRGLETGLKEMAEGLWAGTPFVAIFRATVARRSPAAPGSPTGSKDKAQAVEL
jgi:hypothetical protein